MPVARLSTFFINIKNKKKQNREKKKIKPRSLSAAVSFPSSQTTLPSLSGLPDMLIAM